MTRAIFLAAFFLLGAVSAEGQVDSCLDLYQNVFKGLVYWNPDSVMVDTCGGVRPYPELYAKRYFTIQFKYALIKLDSVRKDSILTVPWTQIDTSYSVVRTAFKNIAIRFGGVWLTKMSPQIGDSTNQRYDLFKLTVGKYAPTDTIESMLPIIPLSPWIEYAHFTSFPVPSSRNVIPLSEQQKLDLLYSDGGRIYIRGLTQKCSFKVFSTLGCSLKVGFIAPGGFFDLNDLEAGCYILQVGGDVNKFFKLFIKNWR